MKAWCAAPLGRACDWTAEGSPEDVDREARRHTGDGLKGGPTPGHATVVAREDWA